MESDEGLSWLDPITNSMSCAEDCEALGIQITDPEQLVLIDQATGPEPNPPD